MHHNFIRIHHDSYRTPSNQKVSIRVQFVYAIGSGSFAVLDRWFRLFLGAAAAPVRLCVM